MRAQQSVNRTIKNKAQVMAYNAALLRDAIRRLTDVFGNRNSNRATSKLRRVVPCTSMSAVLPIVSDLGRRTNKGTSGRLD